MKWVRHNFFGSWPQAIATLLILWIVWKTIPPFIDWAFLDAVWKPDSKACRAGEGACWGFVAEKHRFILFGTYPYELHWRPAIATVLLIGLWIFSAFRANWKWWLALVWLFGLTTIGVLMWGGVFGMPYVENERWGGLILTLLLTTFGVAFAFPLSILLALGRRSDMPVIRGLCVGYIELIRGVPLISLLFMASVMLPLFLPHGITIDKLLRAQIAMIMFAAAYLAEVVRGGLQAIPKGQVEAAQTLGLTYWQTQRKIVLPQALALVVPAIMNNFIAIFKDTSLVTIVSLYELTGAMQFALNSDANWRPFKIEGYIFITLIYFLFCFAMSRYSLWIEKRVSVSKTR